METERVTIAQEAEKQVDLKIAIQEKKKLTGLVVDAQTKSPIAKAAVQIKSRNFRDFREWTATTSADGTFQKEIDVEEALVQIVSPDKTLGAIIEVDELQTKVEVSLKKLGSATGRLLTLDGKQPAPGVKLMAAIRDADKLKQTFAYCFGQVITTGDDGQFTLERLVPDWKYECTLLNNPSGYVLTVTSVKVEAGQAKSLGDLQTPPEPKPYNPPTLAERIQQAFDQPNTPLERFERATELIERANQNLLLLIGDPADFKVKSLMRLRLEDKDYRPYADDYLLLAVSKSEQAFEGAWPWHRNSICQLHASQAAFI